MSRQPAITRGSTQRSSTVTIRVEPAPQLGGRAFCVCKGIRCASVVASVARAEHKETPETRVS
jgi:hypothetical protein